MSKEWDASVSIDLHEMPFHARLWSIESLLKAVYPDPISPPSRVHYIGLDALRGIAALAVVAYHFSTKIDAPLVFSHGYLAVDFFFALSGFVLFGAYSAKLADHQLSVTQFYIARLIRLAPLVFVGTLLAAVIELWRPGDRTPHFFEISYATFLGTVLIPILWQTSMEHVIFPLNGPVWSLFFEAFVNLLFAPLARARISVISLLVASAVSAGVLLIATHMLGTVEFGFSPESFWLGFARVCWSFGVGVFLFPLRKYAPTVPFALTASLLVLILLVPKLEAWNAVYDTTCVLVVLPAIVFIASPVQMSGLSRSLSKISGDLSYPIYALHYPLVRAISFTGRRLQLELPGKSVFIISGTLFIICFAAVALISDVRVRQYLSERFNARMLN
jgi:peptidoglycan/LPS O-acetylase OafA/YrhL